MSGPEQEPKDQEKGKEVKAASETQLPNEHRDAALYEELIVYAEVGYNAGWLDKVDSLPVKGVPYDTEKHGKFVSFNLQNGSTFEFGSTHATYFPPGKKHGSNIRYGSLGKRDLEKVAEWIAGVEESFARTVILEEVQKIQQEQAPQIEKVTRCAIEYAKLAQNPPLPAPLAIEILNRGERSNFPEQALCEAGFTPEQAKYIRLLQYMRYESLEAAPGYGSLLDAAKSILKVANANSDTRSFLTDGKSSCDDDQLPDWVADIQKRTELEFPAANRELFSDPLVERLAQARTTHKSFARFWLETNGLSVSGSSFKTGDDLQSPNSTSTSDLRDIIAWTEEQWQEKISDSAIQKNPLRLINFAKKISQALKAHEMASEQLAKVEQSATELASAVRETAKAVAEHPLSDEQRVDSTLSCNTSYF